MDGKERCIDDEIPFEIPENWAWTRLGNIIELTSGQDFPPSGYNSSGNGFPYITGASNIENGKIIINRWTNTPTSIARKQDLLIVCKGAGVGKMAFLHINMVHIARQIMSIRQIVFGLAYIQVFLEAQIDKIRKQMQGVIPGISRDDIQSLLLPLPPRQEQCRIVAVKERIFARLDK